MWHSVDTQVFCNSMFQWANTLTTSGQNMPFVLPQKVDRTANGFTMTFLKANPQDEFVSVGDIEAQVESIPGTRAGRGELGSR